MNLKILFYVMNKGVIENHDPTISQGIEKYMSKQSPFTFTLSI